MNVMTVIHVKMISDHQHYRRDVAFCLVLNDSLLTENPDETGFDQLAALVKLKMHVRHVDSTDPVNVQAVASATLGCTAYTLAVHTC